MGFVEHYHKLNLYHLNRSLLASRNLLMLPNISITSPPRLKVDWLNVIANHMYTLLFVLYHLFLMSMTT